LIIPLHFVGNLIDNRGRLFNQTVTEIGNEWGKSQKIIAPVISLSYTDSSLSKDDSIRNEKNVVVDSFGIEYFYVQCPEGRKKRRKQC